ncbi:MAG: hypothetical protein JJU11_14900 [Candidatus Sumerlaeia bacterium]|nr:hypothetical protein [Candidatus Sumerlaeia bacterium]
MEALEKEGATLPQDSSIVILKHPHVASEPHNWVYRQLIFDVFLPEGKWKYLGDEQVDAADFIFEYIESGKNVVLHEKEGYPNATAKKTDETRMSIPQER